MKNEKSQTFVTMRFMVLEAKKYKLMYRNYTGCRTSPLNYLSFKCIANSIAYELCIN